MGVVRRLAKSHRDYTDIWLYLAQQATPEVAERVLRELDQAVTMLSNHPFGGQQRSDLGKRLRTFPVGAYLLYYRPIKGGIELLRVLHGSRDAGRFFRRM